MPTIGPDLEKRLAAFFDVYDIDGNGDIDISEFNKIEVRLEVQSSEASKMWGLGGMDADADPAGTIFYDQFRTRMIRIMHMASLSEEIFVQKINERINMIVSERKLMGLNYHYGIRCMIQKLFRAFDADNGGEIEAEEWIVATKVIADGLKELTHTEDLDMSKYHGADDSGDGNIDPDEFMEFMYSVLEPFGEKYSGDEIEEILKQLLGMVPTGSAQRMIKLPLFAAFPDVVLNRKNEWQHPNQKAKSCDGWEEITELAIDPVVMKTARDIKQMIAIKLALPYATEMSLFYRASATDPVFRLLPEEGDELRDVFKTFHKSTGVKQLWVKNFRVAPLLAGCKKVEVITDEEKIEEIQKKMSGQRAGVLDFEDLVHKKGDYPIKGTMKIGLGEQVMCEFPASNMNQKYPYRVEAYVKGDGLITGVVEERLEKTVKKGPPPDFSLRWSFVGEGKPGDAKIIVEIGWDQYEHEMECTDNPYRNETVFQFLADVQCTEEAPKPGSKSNVYWHGLIWDGNQTKASKPK